MVTMGYAERIRHPDDALNPPGDKGQDRSSWFWVLLGLAALAYFAWRMGWLNRIFAAGAKVMSAVKSTSNPHGWV